MISPPRKKKEESLTVVGGFELLRCGLEGQLDFGVVQPQLELEEREACQRWPNISGTSRVGLFWGFLPILTVRLRM